jgi:hypothetical protein
MNPPSESPNAPEAPKRKRFIKRVLWCFFFALGALALNAVITEIFSPDRRISTSAASIIRNLLALAFVFAVLFFVVRLLLRKTTWRARRRILIGAAIFATLIAMLYVVENVRGRRAWDACKKRFAAQGVELEWSAYMPREIPDDQNMFKAPKITEWFGRRGSNEWSSLVVDLGDQYLLAATNPVIELTVLGPNQQADSADLIVQYEPAPATNKEMRQQLAELVKTSVVEVSDAATIPQLRLPQGGRVSARPLVQVHPRRVVMRAQKVPTINELANIFSPLKLPADAGSLRVRSLGQNRFHVVLLNGTCPAAAYLAWSDPLQPHFDTIRAALKRPAARVEGNYERPFFSPLPNYVGFRNVAQMLAARAHAYLLLGQPREALQELTLIRDMGRLLEAKPVYLVGSMIEVAVSGLYVNSIQEGLRLRAWTEPELAALQGQLEATDLLPVVVASLESERAAVCRTYETISPSEWGRLVVGNVEASQLQMMRHWEYWRFALAPRGWIHQNLVSTTDVSTKSLAAYDPNTRILRAQQTERMLTEAQQSLDRFPPYSFLSRAALPNYLKVWQNASRNQTLVNQAAVACALERYRLALGNYPETLDALVPRFTKKLPYDLFGGAPLKYQQFGNQYQVYSIGWNEKDDGGQPSPKQANNPNPDWPQGDWVWPPAEK